MKGSWIILIGFKFTHECACVSLCELKIFSWGRAFIFPKTADTLLVRAMEWNAFIFIFALPIAAAD